MAAPYVTGVAALLAARGLSAPAIVNRLESTATDLGPTGRDRTYGYGLVNAAAAVGVVNKPTAGVTGPARCGTFVSRGITVQVLVHAGTIACAEATKVLQRSARGEGVRGGAAGTASPPGWKCYAGGPGIFPVAGGFSCENGTGVLIVAKDL
jgi:subtilisin family serine protease